MVPRYHLMALLSFNGSIINTTSFFRGQRLDDAFNTVVPNPLRHNRVFLVLVWHQVDFIVSHHRHAPTLSFDRCTAPVKLPASFKLTNKEWYRDFFFGRELHDVHYYDVMV